MTLALPKPGLLTAPETGELYLADISVPPALYKQLGLDVPPLFAQAPVRRLHPVLNPILDPDLDPDRAAPVPRSGLAWFSWWQALRLILAGKTSATALRIALVVGTLLSAVNLAGPILAGQLTAATAIRMVANYLIPYVVSSLGALSQTRVRR